MKKKWHLALLCATAFAVTPIANCIDLKIGIVNKTQLISAHPLAKQLEKEIPEAKQQIMAQTAPVEKKLQEKTEKLKRDGAILSAAEKSKIEAECKQMLEEQQKRMHEFRENLTKRHTELLTQLSSNIEQSIEKVAKADGYDFVFDKESVPYVKGGQAKDITDKVLAVIKKG